MTSFTNFQLEWQVQAVDNDWADNGRVQYSLINATPSNGRSKFVINAETGVIDAVGAVNPGEKYALNLEVSYWHSAQANQMYFYVTKSNTLDLRVRELVINVHTILV